MMSDDEWIQLLEHLLECLGRIEAHADVFSSIRSVISEQVVEQKTPRPPEPESEELPLLGSFSVRMVDPASIESRASNRPTQLHTFTRSLSPKEAFIKAIEVIEIRVTMLPKVAKRTSELLQASRIVWRSEEYTNGQNNNLRLEVLSDSLEFSSEALLIQTEDQKKIELNLNELKNLLQSVR
jgi:hypothetical protein